MIIKYLNILVITFFTNIFLFFLSRTQVNKKASNTIMITTIMKNHIEHYSYVSMW